MTTPFLAAQAGQATGAELATRVEVAAGPPSWSYTLFNDEPAESPQFIKFFQLDVGAPFTVTGTPAGWGFDTDGSSYVLWFNTDEQLPYPNDVAPGASLGGFEIESAAPDSVSSPFGLVAWDHDTDQAGLVTLGEVLAPGNA
jgi:hypothetical protein